MNLTNKEKQAAYKKRMEEAGYKRIQLWVPKESEGKAIKMERKYFVKRLEEITVGWSKSKLSRLFRGVLNYISDKINKGDI